MQEIRVCWKIPLTYYFPRFGQNRFDALKRSYETYHRGEQLFGLPQTEFPRLLAIEKELKLLSKLYLLYESVMDCIDKYKEKLWADLNVEEFGEELTDFQNRSNFATFSYLTLHPHTFKGQILF